MTLIEQKNKKYAILVQIGVNTGLRVSDILALQVYQIKPKMTIIERKTGKTRQINLSDSLLLQIKKYIKNQKLKKTDYLIFSRNNHKDKPLSRIQAYRVMSACGRSSGLDGIGTHTMRKTFARLHYLQHKDLQALQAILNHKYPHTTLMYLLDTANLAL